MDTTEPGSIVLIAMEDIQGLSTAELLRRSATAGPDRIAIIWDKVRLSYADLDRAASRFANALIAAGIAKGDVVAIMSGNRPEYAIAHFGIARAGAVSAHLSTRFTPDEIDHALHLVEARAIVREAVFADVPELDHAFLIGGSFDNAITGAPDTDPDIAVAPDDPGSIIFTGGTTGLPKAALHSHAARTHWCRVAINDFGLDADEIAVVAAPMYHAAGGFIWFQPTIAAGGTAVLQGHWDVPAFIAAVEAHSGTGAFLVPTQVAMLLDHPAFDADRLASLRKVVYGASPVPPGLIARATEALPGARFIQNFGQTETGPMISLHPEAWAERPEALGRASPLVEAAVFVEPGKRAAPGEIGEIAARGIYLMTGYVGDPAATAAFFKAGDEWGYTGDLAHADADGLITLVDRLKDMIIAGGVNIYPAEIEGVVARHPAVADCAAIGVPDPTWGETPVLAVVLRAGASASVADLETWCARRIARYKRPRRIEITDTIPRTGAGKIQRNRLRERFG